MGLALRRGWLTKGLEQSAIEKVVAMMAERHPDESVLASGVGRVLSADRRVYAVLIATDQALYMADHRTRQLDRLDYDLVWETNEWYEGELVVHMAGGGAPLIIDVPASPFRRAIGEAISARTHMERWVERSDGLGALFRYRTFDGERCWAVTYDHPLAPPGGPTQDTVEWAQAVIRQLNSELGLNEGPAPGAPFAPQ